MENKQKAGEKAGEYIKDGMVIGLGTGSTVYYTIMKLGKLVLEGLNIRAVATSSSTEKLAGELKIPLISMEEIEYIDLTIDGADEVDNVLNGIKGGGGALLYEKLVAVSSKKVIWVIDSGKLVNRLGKFPLPVEVVPFSYKQVFKRLQSMGFNPSMRLKGNNLYVTDGGHNIIDLDLGTIQDPYKLAGILDSIPGIVEHGLFLDIADTLIMGKDNEVEIINRKNKG